MIPTYIEANCFKYTFDSPEIKEWVEDKLYGDVANLFAGKNRLNGDFLEYRVDTNVEFNPAYHMSATNFLKQRKRDKFLFDCMIYDPPWNERKAMELFEGHYIGKHQRIKETMVDTLKLDGIIVSIGYEITYMGNTRGFEQIDLLVVNPKGKIRPYFVSVEQKVFQTESIYDWF